ncbi:hypothetical protein J595_04001 [Acinetobacter sp. 1592897]|nr:hypothetical protein J595_04001 [Acinetobacter sp. 1592897]
MGVVINRLMTTVTACLMVLFIVQINHHPIKSGCQNNATYCDMPPTGCGSGYVSGSYNGKQICVKIAIHRQRPKDPPPIPDPPATSDPPLQTRHCVWSSSTNPPPPLRHPEEVIRTHFYAQLLKPLMRSITKLTWVKNEIVNALAMFLTRLI